MININLYYFVSLAEDLNMSRTARRLYISQQALSEQIRKLEKQYNAVFFERTPRLRLTYQGEKMLSYAKKAIAGEQELISSLRADDRPGRARISIGVATSRASVILPSVVKLYREKYPNVILSLVSSSVNGMPKELLMGNIDLYFGMPENALSSSVILPLYGSSLSFMVSEEMIQKEFPDNYDEKMSGWQNGIPLEDAVRFPLAFPPSGTSLRTIFERILAEKVLVPDVVLESSSQSAMLEICRTGTCCSYISKELLDKEQSEGRLPEDLRIFPALGMPEMEPFGVIYNKGQIAPHVRDFIQICKEVSYTARDISLPKSEALSKYVKKYQRISEPFL